MRPGKMKQSWVHICVHIQYFLYQSLPPPLTLFLRCAPLCKQTTAPPVLCSRCKLSKYCCQDHAQHHWHIHKRICREPAAAEALQDASIQGKRPLEAVCRCSAQDYKAFSHVYTCSVCTRHARVPLARAASCGLGLSLLSG